MMRTPTCLRQALSALAVAVGLLSATAASAQTRPVRAPHVIDPALTDPGYTARKLAQAAPASAAVAPTSRRGINPPGTPLPECFEPLDKNTYTPVPRNDDGSLGPIALGFDFYLFGTAYNQVYINTNGNITFDNPFGGFIPSGFPIVLPMISAFWNDVDTRTPATGDRGQAWYRLYNDRLVVTWDSVGRFSNITTLKNTFQIKIFANAGGLLAQDVQFAYGDMQWATSTGAGSVNGFGGPGSTVGVNEGNGTGRYIQVGRFSLDGDSYVDNTSDSGVDYLDYKCFGFRVFDGGNQPPAVAGLPGSGAITVNQGQTVNVTPIFTGPEPSQVVTVSVTDGVPCNSSAIVGSGNNPAVAYSVTGAACNVGTYTVFFVATDNGSPVESSTYTLTVTVNPALTGREWDGDVSTDYQMAQNWVGDVLPQPADSVFIPGSAPRFPVLTGDVQASNFRVGAGAIMTIAAGATLHLTGNLRTAGLFGGTGTLQLSGSTRQRLGGPADISVGSLEVGLAGAQQASNLRIFRVLDLTGNLDTGGFACQLTSGPSGTAMVVNRGTGRVIGNATVQRWVDPSRNAGLGYRHVSTPVSGQTVQSLAGPLYQPVVNAQYNTVGNSATPFPNIFSYDQARVTQSGRPGAEDFDMGWQSPARPNAPLLDGIGYTINMLGTSPIAIGTPPTLTFTGALNNGPVSSGPLARGGQTESGWHLLGNPYPAPLDWTQAFGGAQGLDNAVYVFKSTGQYAGSYESFVNGVGTARFIPVAQGFFVRTSSSATPGRLDLTNAARVTSYQNPAFERQAPGRADQRPQLRLELRTPTGQTDAAYVYFEAGATAAFDARYDAYKLQGGNLLSLATGNPAQALSISGLPALTPRGAAVPLHTYVPQAGTYTLRLAELLNLPAATPVLLEDRATSQWLDLRQQPDVSFQAASATAAASRFVLHIGQQRSALATSASALPAEAVQLFPNPASATASLSVELGASKAGEQLQISILNALGQPLRRLTLPVAQGQARATLNLNGLAPGIYTVRGQSAGHTFARSLVVQ